MAATVMLRAMTKYITPIVVVLILIGLGAFLFWPADDEEDHDDDDRQPAAAVSQTPAATATPTADSGPAAVSGESQQLNAAESTIAWSASKILSNFHTGTVPLTSGSITRNEAGDVVAAEFVADMANLTDDDGSARLETHLKSDDFFAVEQHPTASFALTSATPTQWTGGLTIRGITNDVSFPVTLTSTEESTTVAADLTFDRTRWDITFDSGSVFLTLGDKAIIDDVELRLKLVLEYLYKRNIYFNIY